MTTYVSVPRALEFDSAFWDVRMCEVDYPFGDELGDTYDFAQSLQPTHPTAFHAQGFYVADVRVTLDQRLERSRPVSIEEVRPFEEPDLPALVRIARESHRITRYYADRWFPDDKCDDFYEMWIRNSVAGWADKVLVAGMPAHGYVTVHLSGGVASIGLIAVAAEARGQGIGQRLVNAALRWAQTVHGAMRMTVVTQGRNVNAQRLFQRCGFRTCDTQLWLHKWYR